MSRENRCNEANENPNVIDDILPNEVIFLRKKLIIYTKRKNMINFKLNFLVVI